MGVGSYARKGALVFFVSLFGLFGSTSSFGTPDEIKVLTNKLVEPGEFEGTLYTNYVFRGRDTALYEGEVAPRHTWRITPEFSYGLNEHWDTGFFLPISYSKDHDSHIDGARARIKYISEPQQADELEFYGADAELWYADKSVSTFSWRAELKGIVGLHRPSWLIAFNPILTWNIISSHVVMEEKNPLSESRLAPEFGYAFKAMYKLEKRFALGVEHYAEMGSVKHIQSWGNSADEVSYIIFDFIDNTWDFNFGVGHGWTREADKSILKMSIAKLF